MSILWDYDYIDAMTTDDIVRKMRSIVPGFDLDEFIDTTERYISADKLTETEYGTYTENNPYSEDFVWVASAILWKRFIPDRMAVEHLVDVIEESFDVIDELGEFEQIVKLSTETFELVWRYIVEETDAGYVPGSEYYTELMVATSGNLIEFLVDHLLVLKRDGQYEKMVELSQILYDVFQDDNFLGLKARGYIALNRIDESEKLFDAIIERNPGNIFFPINAGDSFLDMENPDFEKAGSYYMTALDYYNNNENMSEYEQILVYQKLIDFLRESGKIDTADLMQNMMDGLEKLKRYDEGRKKKNKISPGDPCPCGSGKKYRNCHGAPPPDPRQGILFDMKSMERSYEPFDEEDYDDADGIPDIDPEQLRETNRERAEDLLDIAVETRKKKEKISLAEEALELCPDLVEAYIILAEEKARNVEEACTYYQAGMEAGEREIGKELFETEEGYFWGLFETRTYMIVRAGLAHCLLEMGRTPEAMTHYRELLRLNRSDTQGIRIILAACLLELDEIDELERLLDLYEDEPSSIWKYTQAVVAFLREGDTTKSRELLLEAMEINPYLPEYMLAKKKLPKKIPEKVSIGEKSEAVAYFYAYSRGWLNYPETILWLQDVYERREVRKKRVKKDIISSPDSDFTVENADEDIGTGIKTDIYTFKVTLKDIPGVWRKIEMTGEQTLHRLHEAIFKAFERDDEHLYAFFLSNKRWDRSSEYGPSYPESDAGDAVSMTINSLHIRPKKKFLYVFDFGDEWWHDVQLLEIRNSQSKENYPRITEIHGESPSQYEAA